jgi:rhodanese-related sulfurtransferase
MWISNLRISNFEFERSGDTPLYGRDVSLRSLPNSKFEILKFEILCYTVLQLWLTKGLYVSKKRSNTRRTPSKPVAQYRMQQAARKRSNPLGLVMVGVVALAVVFIVAMVAMGSGNSNNNANGQAGAVGAQSAAVSNEPPATATEVAFLTAVADVQRVTVQEAKSLYDAKSAQIVDVRPASDYAQLHIAGAINIPHDDVNKRIAEIPKSGLVIFYCECPNDEESASTAKSLMRAGYQGIRIIQGPDALTLWKDAGYPTEGSSK